MERFVEWIESVARTLGGPGLFLVAFLDSSFLSLPQINDLLVIWAVMQRPALLMYYAGMATAGSVAGCVVLYGIASRGGEAFLKSRFGSDRLEARRRLVQRHGVLAVLVPSLLPPPAPFKLFVLLAGAARVPLPKFILAVGIGRGVRYFGEGWLAVVYGEAAIAFLEANTVAVSLGLVALVLVGAAGYWLWRRRSAQRSADV